jgi:sulfite reductase (NADPH) flavoprotein alpha-component
MLESGKELYEWLESGAYFYVCGDATKMAKDVDQALHTLIQKHGNLNTAKAVEYVKNLKKEKRYLRDVY